MKAFISFLLLSTAVAFAQTSRLDTLVSPEVLPDRRVTFRVRAPNASEVSLFGDWMMPNTLGGGHALQIGLSHLELFSAVAAFSPAVSGNFESRFKPLLDDPAGTNKKLKRLWIGCGRQDPAFERNQKLSELLTAHKVRNTSPPLPGPLLHSKWKRGSGRAPELTAACENVFAVSEKHGLQDPTPSAANGTSSSGLGGGDNRPAAVALLAPGENRAVLLRNLLFSLVVLHCCGGFCGLQIAGCFASAGSSEGIPVSRGLVRAAVDVVRGGEPAHPELVLCHGAVVIFMGYAVSPPRIRHSTARHF